MKTKLFALLFALVASIGTMFAWDYERVQIDDLYYNLNDTELIAEVTRSDNSYSGSVVIPESITYDANTYSVISIEEYAFYQSSSLTSVTIGNSIISIGEMAFADCSGLTSLSVETGNTLFDSRDNCNAIIETTSNTLVAGCQNTVIPNSVTSIGDGAFWGRTGLTSIIIPNSVVSIGISAFNSCSNLTEINLPTGITEIRMQCFVGCRSLTSINIPDGVTIIYAYAFRQCTGLESIIIPNSVTLLQQNAFHQCSGLKSATIGNKVSVIPENAFAECNSLESIIIPSSVTEITKGSFWDCNNLMSISVETGNTHYDSRNNCNAIIETSSNKLVLGCQNTIIPSDVTSIEGSAFYDCKGLNSLTIPSSVTSIGERAFKDCSNLTAISCETVNPPTLGSEVFTNVAKSIPLYVPSGSIAAYQTAEGWSEFTNIRAIGDNSGGSTPLFPDDPGTLTLNLELSAYVVDGDSIMGQAPTGGGGYPKGTEVTVTARDIPGYEFVQWSDSVTDKTRTIVLNESMTLIAYYTRSMIEMAVAANQWTFICLPPLGDRQYMEDMFTYDGLTGVKWGTYNGEKRAAGQSGWETPETFNALQGYIIYSTTAGTLRINAYQDEIRQGESENISVPLTTYESDHTENASWNFLGNPYAQGFSIAGLADAGIESPITVWNGTGYTTYTPGIDDYTLQPFEAFFIQKAEGAPDTIQFVH